MDWAIDAGAHFLIRSMDIAGANAAAGQRARATLVIEIHAGGYLE
jgi:hypothetical protein